MSAPKPGELDPSIENRKNRAWREVAAIDAALEHGEIDAAGWHRAIANIIVPAYLAGDNPRAQSGFAGDERRWEAARRPILEAVDRCGTFLDVGCASGLLMGRSTAGLPRRASRSSPTAWTSRPSWPSWHADGSRGGRAASSPATPSTGRRRTVSPSSGRGSSTCPSRTVPGLSGTCWPVSLSREVG